MVLQNVLGNGRAEGHGIFLFKVINRDGMAGELQSKNLLELWLEILSYDKRYLLVANLQMLKESWHFLTMVWPFWNVPIISIPFLTS